MVELVGLEPTTSSMPRKRSTPEPQPQVASSALVYHLGGGESTRLPRLLCRAILAPKCRFCVKVELRV